MAFYVSSQQESFSDSPKPPKTNRGAEITAPSENRSLIDWAGFTLRTDCPQEVAGIIGLNPSQFSPLSFGFSGYRKSLCLGNISIYYDGRKDMGCHVEMTGQGCRQYEGHFSDNPWPDLFATVLKEQGQFTRLDLALDTVDGSLPLDRVVAAVEDRQVRTRFGEWRQIRKGGFRREDNLAGETLYLGSTKSHLQFRIYNKAQEAGIEADWIRFEIQLRSKRAQEAARLFDSSPVGVIASGIINNYFAIIDRDDANASRCSLQEWWADWLQTTEKIRLSTEKETRFVSDSMDFIRKQYGPSLAMIRQHLGQQPFKAYVGEILEEGKQRMGKKHERILSASQKGKPSIQQQPGEVQS